MKYSGFTLIELLIVIGIAAMLGTLGLYVSLDAYRAYVVRTTTDQVVNMLRKARQEALSNAGEQNAGVEVADDVVTLFQGDVHTDPAPLRLYLPHSITMVPESGTLPFVIMFAQASGEATAVTLHVEHEQGKRDTIMVNEQGGIIW